MKGIGEAAVTILAVFAIVFAIFGIIAIADEFIEQHHQGICHGAGYSGYVLHEGSRYCFIVDSECPSVVLLEDLEKEAPRGQ